MYASCSLWPVIDLFTRLAAAPSYPEYVAFDVVPGTVLWPFCLHFPGQAPAAFSCYRALREVFGVAESDEATYLPTHNTNHAKTRVSSSRFVGQIMGQPPGSLESGVIYVSAAVVSPLSLPRTEAKSKPNERPRDPRAFNIDQLLRLGLGQNGGHDVEMLVASWPGTQPAEQQPFRGGLRLPKCLEGQRQQIEMFFLFLY